MITFIEYWIWKIRKEIDYFFAKRRHKKIDPFIYEDDDK